MNIKILCSLFGVSALLFLSAPIAEAMYTPRRFDTIRVPVVRVRDGKEMMLPMFFVNRHPRLYRYKTGDIKVTATGVKRNGIVGIVANAQFSLELLQYTYPYPMSLVSSGIVADSNGQAVFTGVLPGEYRLLASSPDYVGGVVASVAFNGNDTNIEVQFTQLVPLPSPPPGGSSSGGGHITITIGGQPVSGGSPMPSPLPSSSPNSNGGTVSVESGNTVEMVSGN